MLRCTTLRCNKQRYNALCCTALRCTTLRCTTLRCTTLRCTTLHYNMMQRSAPRHGCAHWNPNPSRRVAASGLEDEALLADVMLLNRTSQYA
jgi:hypothetical protein